VFIFPNNFKAERSIVLEVAIGSQSLISPLFLINALPFSKVSSIERLKCKCWFLKILTHPIDFVGNWKYILKIDEAYEKSLIKTCCPAADYWEATHLKPVCSNPVSMEDFILALIL
jgi:hypothetical protein